MHLCVQWQSIQGRRARQNQLQNMVTPALLLLSSLIQKVLFLQKLMKQRPEVDWKVYITLSYSSCGNGQWHCKDAPCPGKCQVYGNGHYQTFDSKWYRFNGHCQYTLVEVRPNMKVGLKSTAHMFLCSSFGGIRYIAFKGQGTFYK